MTFFPKPQNSYVKKDENEMDSEQSNEDDIAKNTFSKRTEDKLPMLRKEKISFAKNPKNARDESMVS